MESLVPWFSIKYITGKKINVIPLFNISVLEMAVTCHHIK